MYKRTPLGGRYLYPVSEKELRRRWEAVRAAMKKQGVEVLIIQNEYQDLGGYVRWFSDVPAGYPETIIFPADEEMIMITSGAPSHPIPPEFMRRGIQEAISSPYFRTLNFTNEYDADIVVKKIREMGKKYIGFVNLGRMHACFYNKVVQSLSDCSFTDMTDEVDQIKAVKSPEEMEAILAAVALHDKVMGAAPVMIRPGRREADIRNDIHDLAQQLDAEGQMFIGVGSDKIGKPFGQLPLLYAGRVLEHGDYFHLLLESSGPGGYFCELGRMFCLGDPSPELEKTWRDTVKAQEICAQMLVPGGDPVAIFHRLNTFLSDNGYAPEERLFAHGQGYDLIERPGITPGETMKLMQDMYIVLHPQLTNRQAMCVCADNFIVTPTGGVRLHKTPQELFLL